MSNNHIEFSILDKKGKKKYNKVIFMPKFLLNVINLTKKAEKKRNKKNPSKNEDLFLEFKTTFNHMPKINIISYRNDSNKNGFSKFRYISLFQKPEPIIIKKTFPRISNNFDSTFFDNKNKISDLKADSDKLKKYRILNKNNSCLNIKSSRNKNALKNFIIQKKDRDNWWISQNNFYMSRNNVQKQFGKVKESNNINKSNNTINTNKVYNNNIESYMNNKFKKYIIINKENNEMNNSNNNNINELLLQQDKKKREKYWNLFKTITTNFSAKKTNLLPNNFKTKESIINSYLNTSSLYIKYSFNINPDLNINANNIYYFNINKMYRRQMIDYMKHRINWRHIDYSNVNLMNNSPKNSITINFEWKYYSNRINYKKYKYNSNMPNKKLKMINLFEKNNEIGNKKNMFLNMISYCDKINYNIFDIVPFTMIFSNTREIDWEMESLKEIMDFLEENKNSKQNIVFNKLYKDQFWYDKNFENINNQIIYFNKNFISDKNYWILKPTDMYQGKYIEISNSFEDIYRKCFKMFKGVNSNLSKEIMEIEEENQKNENITSTNINTKKKINMKKSNESRMYCCNDIIIQKYLDNPLLYKKRKFDIRCFVLLDSNLNLFYCKEGHLKGSSELYNVENSNKFIHITNYSFQKKTSNFAKYEYGNEISYEAFKQFLKEEGFPPDKFNTMIEEMKFLIKISFKSVSKKIYKTNDVLCFELFGYDFIIDNEFKPWILEINNNPGLGISSPVIQKIIPRMIDDAFRLTIDKVFNTIYDSECFDKNGKYKTRFPIDGYKKDENIFEFLCNIK